MCTNTNAKMAAIIAVAAKATITPPGSLPEWELAAPNPRTSLPCALGRNDRATHLGPFQHETGRRKFAVTIVTFRPIYAQLLAIRKPEKPWRANDHRL